MRGRRVLLAGATGPVGRAIGVELARQGAALAVHTHDEAEHAEALVQELERPDDHVVVTGDLAVPAAVTACLDEAERVWRAPVTDLVNCAWPPGRTGALALSDPTDFEDALDGVRVHLNLLRGCATRLRAARGAVVLVSSALAIRLHPGLALISATKAAATVASQVFALEEGVHGVRSNVVSPGRIEVGAELDPDPSYASLEAIARQRRSLPQVPVPSDVGHTVAWLLAAPGVTGQDIAIAGGEPL